MSARNNSFRQVTFQIPESKYPFFMELAESLQFVKKIEDLQSSVKSKKVSNSNGKLMQDLKEAMSEVKLYREGKLKLKTAEQLLNEL